jgi:hypothetical protein
LFGLLLAEVGLINQGPDFALSQQIPALVDGDLVEPSAECGALIEALQREVRLDEYLLGDIFDIFAPMNNTAGYCENAVLMAADELLESLLVFGLGAPDEFAVVCGIRSGCARAAVVAPPPTGLSFGTRGMKIWLRLSLRGHRGVHQVFHRSCQVSTCITSYPHEIIPA